MDSSKEDGKLRNLKLNNFLKLFAQWLRILVAHLLRYAPTVVRLVKADGATYFAGAVAPESRLSAVVHRVNGDIEELGIISTKVVTTAFVNFLVDQLQSSTGEIANFSWHEMGTGSGAEAIGDTTLVTAVETRTDGTQAEGASVNIYQSVGTITATATRAIIEHGLFDASTVGNLMDRSVFTVINLAIDDAIQFTYELTVPAGS